MCYWLLDDPGLEGFGQVRAKTAEMAPWLASGRFTTSPTVKLVSGLFTAPGPFSLNTGDHSAQAGPDHPTYVYTIWRWIGPYHEQALFCCDIWAFRQSAWSMDH